MIIGVTRTQYPYCKKNACVVWQPSWLKNPFSESSISLTSNYHKKVKTVPSYKRLSPRSLPSQLFCCVSKNSSLAISFIRNELCCCFAKDQHCTSVQHFKRVWDIMSLHIYIWYCYCYCVSHNLELILGHPALPLNNNVAQKSRVALLSSIIEGVYGIER